MKSQYSFKYLLITAILFPFASSAQEESNLQKFTPSVLFEPGNWDAQIFTSIYSQNKVRNRAGVLQDISQRQTFLTTRFDINVGVASNLNLGLEMYINRTFLDSEDRNSSPLRVLSSGDDSNSRFAFSYLGPKIRWQPFGSIPTLSLQSLFLIPIANNLEDPIFLNHDRYSWYTQIFYDQAVNEKFRWFFDLGLLYQINRNSTNEGDFIRIPFSIFWSYFPSSRVSLFSFMQYSARLENVQTSDVDEVFGLNGWFTQLGVGAKYQASQKIGLEFSYSAVVLGKSEGAGTNLNFGVRYIY